MRWCLLAALLACAIPPVLAQDPVDADILLTDGILHDGSGAAPRIGHVAIRKGRIVAVGEFPVGKVGWKLDCKGLVIAPGFIDLHTHSDSQVVDGLLRASTNYLLQGCTTQVTGNCGSGPVDVGEYYRKINADGAGTNVAHLLPQGNLRDKVVGDVDRKATDDEIQQMRDLAAKAMHDGAWGMSTGLIYVPSVYASTEELIEVAKVVAAGGGIYASHIRGEGKELLNAVDEALRIGETAGCPVHISHFKASGQENWGTLRLAAERIEQARKAGRTATADQYPYTASSTSLEATVVPTWARSGGSKALIARLDNPETGPKLRREIQRDLERSRDGAAIFIARYSAKPEWIGLDVKQIAEKESRTPLEITEEICRNGGAAVVNFSMSEDDVRYAMQLPWVATASDGRSYLPGPDKPHPRSYGTFSRKIGRYAIADGVLPLEQAIRSCSGLPADIIGFKDRGYLKADYAADVVVLDPEKFRDVATFAEPHQLSQGAKYVFVNGTPAVFAGQPTGALAGKALKHPAPQP